MINEQEPLPGTDVDSQTPSLSASAIVPGGYPANPALSFAFQIVSGTGLGRHRGAVVGLGREQRQLLDPDQALTWGSTYYWQATVSDAATPAHPRPDQPLDDADLVRGG